MRLDDVFSTIESIEFESNILIASGPILFNTILSNDETIHQLVEMLYDDENGQQAVFERLKYLLNLPTQKGYFHEHDVAIATYVWVLSKVNDALTLMATKLVLGHPQMHWGRMIARDIREAIVLSGMHMQLNSSDSSTVSNMITFSDVGQTIISDPISSTTAAGTTVNLRKSARFVIQPSRKEAS